VFKFGSKAATYTSEEAFSISSSSPGLLPEVFFALFRETHDHLSKREEGYN
jgi:hypothetical protein